ncbi:MAG: GGDEF domain-containing protein [Desulfobacterales bacterium]|nr:GGDEF domain-containing protein [Desulfobacterales bacterium]
MVFTIQPVPQRVIRDLKRRSAAGVFFYLINIIVVLFADGYHARHPEAAMTLFLMVVLACGFRAGVTVLDPWLPKGVLGNGIFMGGILLTGLCWGVGFSMLVLQEAEVQTRFLMTICTIGLCSGGMIAYHPCLSLSVLFTLFIFGPGTVAVLAYSDQMGFGLLMIIYSAYINFMALRSHQEYWNALKTETLLEQRTRDLEELSLRDGLTGLANRRSFDQSFDYEWKRALRIQSRLSLLICDIDHFKRINDDYSHLAGDAYLKMTARIMGQVFRRETDIVARFGGEEFVVLIQDISHENMLAKAEEVRAGMEGAILDFEGREIHATVSIGVAAMVPEMGQDKEVLLARADACLYRSKNSGRNQIHSALGKHKMSTNKVDIV